jgi:hypothetical protein
MLTIQTILGWFKRRPVLPVVVGDVAEAPAPEEGDGTEHHAACRGIHRTCTKCGMPGCVIPQGGEIYVCTSCFHQFRAA